MRNLVRGAKVDIIAYITILCREFYDKILNKLEFTGPIILVTGTNGKTSTANMIADCVSYAGYKVFSNRKGDNLKAGITTTLLSNASLSGRVNATACVLEVDE